MIEDRTPNEDRSDDVARLVRLAGQRPPVPGERVARVRAAAREAWLRESRRRSRRRLIWGGVALAAAASLAVAVIGLARLPGLSGGGEVAGVGGALPVELEAGSVMVRELAGGRLGPPRSMAASETIPPGSVLATATGHRAALRLPSGHSLRLDEASEVRLDNAGTVHIERGALYLASAAEAPAEEGLRVITPLGSLQEIGTQYAVRLMDGSVRIRVREGAVIMHGASEAREVRMGTEMEIRPDGTAATRSVPTHGAPWDWVSSVTPMIDLEGRSARSFLDWVARERGWTLEFASDELAASADSIIVAGDIRGMTVEESLSAVLPSCRMTHRLEGGTLEIRSLP